MSRRSPVFLSALVVFAWAGPAAAHINMTNPPARYPMDQLKDGPCGMVGNPPGVNAPAVLQAGDTITITLNEFTNHPGHFRISFSEDGTDQFVNPTAFDDFYPDDSVLMDDIPDIQDGGIHEIEFEVPNVNCNPCTLQALQVMTEGSFSEGSLYYQCADIVIEGAAGSGTDTGGDDDPTATASATASATTTAGNDTSSDGGGDDGTTAGVDDTGDDAPAETGATADDATGGSVTATGTTDTDEDDDGASGCGCTTGARPNGLLAMPLLLLGFRRRRR